MSSSNSPADLHKQPHQSDQPGMTLLAGDSGSSQVLLQEKLDFIQLLTSRVPSMLFQFRLQTDRTAHFLYASEATRHVLGVTSQALMADAVKALRAVHVGDRSAMWVSIKLSERDLTPWRHEFRVKLHNYTVLWMFGDAMPLRQSDGSVLWHGSVTDITERKREHEELRKTRELMARKAQGLRITLDTMSHGILTMDPEGNVTLYNQRFIEFLDLPESLMKEGVKGLDILEFQKTRGDFGPDLERVEAHAHDSIRAGIVNFSPDRYLRKSHTGRTLEVRNRPLPGGGVVRTFEDVTHFVEAQAALHESDVRFRSLTALSSDWYWEQDENFRFTRVDGQGIATEAYIGRTRWEMESRGLTDEQWEQHKSVLAAHQTFRNFEMQRAGGRNGPMSWTSISGVPIFDAQGVFRGYRGIGRDITEHKRTEDEGQRLAFYDTLTGLPNRRLLLDRMSHALVASARSEERGALLFIDLDNFKDLNDTQGHDIGDKLLEKVANRLVTCVRQGDTVARFGGDEFVVMLEGLNPDVAGAVAQIRVVGQKILAALNQPFDLFGKEHYSTPSIGIALFLGHQQSVDELLKRADLAMYQSKAAGRNTLRFFDPEMQAAVAQRAALESDLRHGLERGELVLYYQSIVNHMGAITGLEALVRWQHPTRGMVSPIDFIPVAEQTGLIQPLGQWVLKTACAQLVIWSYSPVTQGLSIAVNISAREFRQPEFAQQILDILNKTGANPYLLKLELTESLLLTDVQDVIKKMEILRAVGVSFALDDFGIGYSSLSYLKRLPLDQLKIDQSFVRDVLTDPNDAAIARTVVALAHSMGLAVVAEGVETEGQRDFLLRNGCQAFQGYLFGRPVPVSEINMDLIATSFVATRPHVI
jgi:diguanylate cyclase (GGDEF)-like protein/PAS domain S-box-containing protein